MDIPAYIKETKAEMKHVSWPSRREVAIFTAAVIGVSLATALSLGLFDFVFSRSLGVLLVDRPLFRAETQNTALPTLPESGVFNPQVLPTTESGAVPAASLPLDASAGPERQ